MAARTWTCQRVTAGVRCGCVNPKVKHICAGCGKRRPASKREKHFGALKIPYEVYVVLNGGEFCGICGRPPSGKKLDRDHEHAGDGLPRGLLCHSCNRTLGPRMETSARMAGMDLATFLRTAADYIERAEQHRSLNVYGLLDL